MTARQKQIIILVSLILFLIFSVIIKDINAESSRKPVKDSITTEQNTSNNQRGSDNFPLIVKILPAIKNKMEVENEAKEKEDKVRNDKRIIIITGILAVIGFLQLIVFAWQAHRLRQSVKATEKAAEATKNSVDNISKIERAYIFVTIEPDIDIFERIYDVDGFKGNYIFNATVKLWNLGRTPAVITKIRAVISLEKATIPDIKESEIPSGIVVGSDKWKNIPVSLHISDIDRQNIVNWNTIAYCCGRIEYQDVFRGKYVRGFCWEYRPHDSRPTEPWVISNNKELNYEKQQKEGD